jgi:predicted RNA-binding Zn-ribbon protein involved in translation (DUF1610 family)
MAIAYESLDDSTLDEEMKERRCPKCGKLINRQRKRCRTCHQLTPL